MLLQGGEQMRYNEVIKVRVTSRQKEFLERKSCMSRYVRALIVREIRRERQKHQREGARENPSQMQGQSYYLEQNN